MTIENDDMLNHGIFVRGKNVTYGTAALWCRVKA